MDETARRLLRDSRASRPALLAAAVLAVAAAALTVAQAAVLADLLARGFLEHAGAAALQGGLIALAALVAGRAAVLGGFELAGRLGALRVMSDLRRRLAVRLLDGAPVAAGGGRTGELAAAAVAGVDALEDWFARTLPQLALASVVPAAILVYLVTRDPVAAAILAVTLPVLIVFLALVGLAARARARARWRVLSVLSAHFVDVVRGLPTLRAHAREGAQAAHLADVDARFRRETMSTLRLAFLSAFVLELVAMIGTALVAATVGIRLAGGHLQLADGLAVLILAPELYAPVRMLGQRFHASTDGLAAAETILAALDDDSGPVRPEHPVPAPDPRVDPVVVRDLAVFRPGRGAVLDGLSLRIAPRETVAVVGESGAGKSTLAAVLARLVEPASGELSCGGVPLSATDPLDWRRRVAWLPQRPTILRGTLGENIRLGRPDASAAAVAAAVDAAGLSRLVSAVGLDTLVGDGGRALSAGEAQRVAIARAVLRDAPLWILDEPSAHLDHATAAALDRTLARLLERRSALLLVHRPALAAIADRVLELRDGRLVPVPQPLEQLAA